MDAPPSYPSVHPNSPNSSTIDRPPPYNLAVNDELSTPPRSLNPPSYRELSLPYFDRDFVSTPSYVSSHLNSSASASTRSSICSSIETPSPFSFSLPIVPIRSADYSTSPSPIARTQASERQQNFPNARTHLLKFHLIIGTLVVSAIVIILIVGLSMGWIHVDSDDPKDF